MLLLVRCSDIKKVKSLVDLTTIPLVWARVANQQKNKRFNSCFDYKLSLGTRQVWETAKGFSLMQSQSPLRSLKPTSVTYTNSIYFLLLLLACFLEPYFHSRNTISFSFQFTLDSSAISVTDPAPGKNKDGVAYRSVR